MTRLPLVVVLLTTPLLLAADEPAGVIQERAKSPLLGKWIVRSVERDGKPTLAQIGREVGDIISIKEGDGGIGLG